MTGCDLDDYFERVGRYWVFRDRNGDPLPVLFCPFCGERIDYGHEDKDKE